MNVLHAHPPESTTSPNQFQQRNDAQSSAVIERSIIVQTDFNTVCAIEYLKSHNVDARVIERVLLSPDQRRKTHH